MMCNKEGTKVCSRCRDAVPRPKYCSQTCQKTVSSQHCIDPLQSRTNERILSLAGLGMAQEILRKVGHLRIYPVHRSLMPNPKSPPGKSTPSKSNSSAPRTPSLSAPSTSPPGSPFSSSTSLFNTPSGPGRTATSTSSPSTTSTARTSSRAPSSSILARSGCACWRRERNWTNGPICRACRSGRALGGLCRRRT